MTCLQDNAELCRSRLSVFGISWNVVKISVLSCFIAVSTNFGCLSKYYCSFLVLAIFIQLSRLRIRNPSNLDVPILGVLLNWSFFANLVSKKNTHHFHHVSSLSTHASSRQDNHKTTHRHRYGGAIWAIEDNHRNGQGFAQVLVDCRAKGEIRLTIYGEMCFSSAESKG